MYLSVFAEFHNRAVLEAVEKDLGLRVDVAAAPNTLATTPEELDIVATSAKLMITAPPAECKGLVRAVPAPEDEVDALLRKLLPYGFVVTLRNPVTSAGCPMTDRVLLKLPKN